MMTVTGARADPMKVLPPAERYRPIDTRRLERPLLCVNIDAEEEFDWSRPFSRKNTSADWLARIDRAQRVFDRFGIRPVFLMDYPIATNPRAQDIIGGYWHEQRCVVGTQLHPWVTPPHEEVVCPINSFPCNLPADLELRKLVALTDAIKRRFRIQPRIYKAGRYGIDLGRASSLIDLGYEVDTSIVPFKSYAGSGGGPDFTGFPDQPFWVGADRRLMCLPVSQSIVGHLRGGQRFGLERLVLNRYAARIHLPGILARLGLLERVMLSPEGATKAEMCRLIDMMIASGKKIIAVSFHSSSLTPGCTPYVRSERDLSDFLYRLEATLEHIIDRHGAEPVDPLLVKTRLSALSG